MSVKTSTASELTAEDVQKVLVEPLAEKSQFLAAGPTIINSAGPLRLPKNQVENGSDLSWVGESEQIPEKNAEFDEIQLLPSTLKSLKVITRYSNELARQSVIALDAALKNRLVSDVAAKLDTQFFSASGDGVTTPRGLFALTGTQSVDAGGALSFDVLLDAWGKALSANVNVAATKWVITPGDLVALKKIKDTSGRYLVQVDPTQGSAATLFGQPVIVSSRVPDSGGSSPKGRAALVDFSQLVVAQDLAPSVTVLKERFADYDEQAIRVVSRYDLGALNPEAVVTIGGIARPGQGGL